LEKNYSKGEVMTEVNKEQNVPDVRKFVRTSGLGVEQLKLLFIIVDGGQEFELLEECGKVILEQDPTFFNVADAEEKEELDSDDDEDVCSHCGGSDLRTQLVGGDEVTKICNECGYPQEP
jgi:hypothetical protein